MNHDLLREFVGKAILSPSGHNSQPWKFHIDADTITVAPDFSRALECTDPGNRELFISLGCVIESICIVAASCGYSTNITTEEHCHKISFTPTDIRTDEVLAQAIESRTTNRTAYSSKRLSTDIINSLSSFGASFYDTQSREFAKICEYVTMSNNIQLNNVQFKQELKQWMRYSDIEARTTGDGLSFDALGVPSIPVFLRKSATAIGMNATVQNRTDRKKLDNSSHLVIFTSGNDTASLIDCGRRLMRFLLTAESLGVACAYMNQPCEVRTVAEMMQHDLHLPLAPQLILRLGYATPTSRSHRRPISSFLI